MSKTGNVATFGKSLVFSVTQIGEIRCEVNVIQDLQQRGSHGPIHSAKTDQLLNSNKVMSESRCCATFPAV